MKAFLLSTAIISLALASGVAGEKGDSPAFAESMPRQADCFLICQGLSLGEKEAAMFGKNDRARSKGAFYSFDEMFYIPPLPVSETDQKAIEQIIRKCKEIENRPGSIAPVNPRQADYKITRCKSGMGYNIHIYAEQRAIYQYGSYGSVVHLSLDPVEFKKLLSLLDRYKAK